MNAGETRKKEMQLRVNATNSRSAGADHSIRCFRDEQRRPPRPKSMDGKNEYRVAIELRQMLRFHEPQCCEYDRHEDGANRVSGLLTDSLGTPGYCDAKCAEIQAADDHRLGRGRSALLALLLARIK